MSAPHERLSLPGTERRWEQVYVSGIRFSNVKGFTAERAMGELSLPAEAEGSWTVLAGRNGSGKSTLLRTLALTLAGPQVSRNLVQDFSDWITTGEQHAWAKVSIHPDPSVDRLTGRNQALQHSIALEVKWSAPDETSNRPRYGTPPQPQLSSYDDEAPDG